MRTSLPLVILLVGFACVQAAIYSKDNVSPGDLPTPLRPSTVKYNIIQIGAGSAGGLSASLLAKTGCVKVLVLESASPANFSDDTIGIIPGLEYQAYWHPGLEKQFLQWPNDVVHTFPTMLSNTIVRKGRGGDSRISHFAGELGDNRIHKELMSDVLGNPPQWEPEYIWGHVTDKLMNFDGPGLTPNHANQGLLRLQESRTSPWQTTWLDACHNVTGADIVTDFNVLGGSINTCSAEPSTLKTDGTRSITETEYLIPEATSNPNLDLIYDAKVSRILFDRDHHGNPIAIGVEGTFRNQQFSIRFHPSNSYWGGGNHCSSRSVKKYRQVIVSAGTFENVQLLELSGVGRPEELARLKIDPIAEIPAVGENLQDCTSAYVWYISANGTSDEIGFDPNGVDYIASRPGAFVNTGSRDGFLLWTPFLEYNGPEPTVNGLGLSFEMRQEHPGSVRLLGTNHDDMLNVSFPWNDFTLQKHVEALRKIRQIVVDGGIADRFQLTEYIPGADVVSDEDLAFAVTRQMEIISHAAGTTRMTASGDPSDGVVDLEFNVLGVKQLKASSMSVLRYVPGGGGMMWSWVIAFNLRNQICQEIGCPLL